MSSGGAGASGAVFALGELFLDLAVHGIEGLKSTLGGVQTQAQTMATAAQASIQRMGAGVQAQVQAVASSAGAAVQRTAGQVQTMGHALTAIQGPVGSVFRGTAVGAGTLGSTLVTVGLQGVKAFNVIGRAAASLTGQLRQTAVAAAAVGQPGAATAAAAGTGTTAGAAGSPATAGAAVGTISAVQAVIGQISTTLAGFASSAASILGSIISTIGTVLSITARTIFAVLSGVISAISDMVKALISVVAVAIDIVVGVVGALGSALGALGRAGKAAFEYLVKSAKEFGSEIDAAVRKVGSLARWALAGGSAAVSGSFYLYESAQDQIRNLNTALKVTGNEVDGNSKKFQAFAEGIQAQTTTSKEAVWALQTRAVQTGVELENVNTLVKTALGLSRLYGMGQEEAMELVRRAVEGQARGLTRLIPELRQVKDAQAQLDIVVRKGAQGYQAMMEDVHTFSGLLAIAKRTVEDFSRSVGEIFAPTFLPYLQSAIGWLRTLQAAFAQLSQPIKDLIVKWAGIAAAALAFAAALPTVLTWVETVGSAILFMATNPIALAIEALAGLAVAFVLGGIEGDNLAEKLANLWNNPRAAWERFKLFVIDLWAVIRTEYQAASLQIQGVLEDIEIKALNVFHSIRDYLVGIKKDITDYFASLKITFADEIHDWKLLVQDFQDLNEMLGGTRRPQVRRPGAPGALAGGGMPAMATPQAEADRARAREEADRQKAIADLIKVRNQAAAGIAKPVKQAAADLKTAAEGLWGKAKDVLNEPVKAYQDLQAKFAELHHSVVMAGLTPAKELSEQLKERIGNLGVMAAGVGAKAADLLNQPTRALRAATDAVGRMNRDLARATQTAADVLARPLTSGADLIRRALHAGGADLKDMLADPLKVFRQLGKWTVEIAKPLLEPQAQLRTQAPPAKSQEMAADAYLSHIRAAGASIGAKDHDQVLKDHSKAMKEHAAAMKNMKADLVGIAKIHEKDIVNAMQGIMNMGLL